MYKVIGSVLAFLALLVVGYFIDDGFKAKVNSVMGKSAPAQVAKNPVTESVKPMAAKAESKQGGTLDSILEKGVVRVSVQSPAKPFYFVENGNPKGFNTEFLKLLFAQSEFSGKNIKVDTDHAVDTYPDVPKQLLETDNRGKPKVDIAIDGLTFSDDDLSGVVYTVPYVKDFGYSLIVAKGANITSVADLAGKKVGVLKGDPDAKSYAEKNMAGVQVVELSDAAVNGERSWIANAINSRKVDAVVYDYPFGVAEIDGTNLQFAVTKLKGSDIQYKIGVRKADTDLLDVLNSAIRKAMETDEYGSLLRKYFMSAKVVAVKSASSAESTYTVVRGDTLSTIAQSQLGNKMRYGEIEARNNLANPNLITVGQRLVIPK